MDEWISKLPLVERLSNSLNSKQLEDLASLDPREIAEVSKRFCTGFEDFLKEKILSLKTALDKLMIAQANASSGKFRMYRGNYGNQFDFRIPLYDVIGAPNTNWLEGMRLEHLRNRDEFLTANNNITTTAEAEWGYVVEGKVPSGGHMGGNRRLPNIDELLLLEDSVKAGLTRAEVIALVLYTGPMYMLYNTVLRKWPVAKYEELKSKDSLFPTTICVLVSAVQKLAQVMELPPGTVLYRGIDGNMELPPQFTTPDAYGCLGGMEPGFMSTTSDWNTALSYTSGCLPKVLAIVVGAVDRGADISQYSQYPGEREYLWNPRAFLQPAGGAELRVTDKGLIQLLHVKVSSNSNAASIDQYERRKKDLHMASIKLQMQDLLDQLSNVRSMLHTSHSFAVYYVCVCVCDCG